jgi:hypothetical protein
MWKYAQYAIGILRYIVTYSTYYSMCDVFKMYPVQIFLDIDLRACFYIYDMQGLNIGHIRHIGHMYRPS